MDKPRIFLGSSGKQTKLLQALTRGLEDVAYVEPWTTSFNPGTTTLGRLLELSREVDFAAFVFARDDWTSDGQPATESAGAGQASPRDNVVFEAGLFGGALGMRRTFILHAKDAKLPTDLLGLTVVRYDPELSAAELKTVYRAESADVAAAALERFSRGSWGQKYPPIVAMWQRHWEQVTPFFSYPLEVRKIIYTTNAIESLHMQLRKIIKNRGHFPNDDAAVKLLYLALKKITRDWKMSAREWKSAMNQFAILFADRFLPQLH